ncbi:MAG: ABC transporter substrate-binding protein [Cyanophyceae cyanobacterium]
MKQVVGAVFLGLTVAITSCSSQPSSNGTDITWGGPKNISMLPILAQEQGYFAEAGLETERQDIQTGKQTLDTLISGNIDFGIVVEPTIATIKFQPGTDIKVIAVIQEKFDDAIVARKDKGINSAKDLEGKTLGLTYTTTAQMFAVEYLQSQGVDLDKVEMINMPPPAIQAAVVNGELDAGSMWQPFRYNTADTLGDNGIVMNDPIYKAYAIVAVRADFAEENPEAIESFLQALIEAEEYLEENPQEAQEILAREIDIPLEVLQLAWEEYEVGVSMSGGLLDTITKQGEWVASTEPEFQDQPLPDYEETIAPEFLKGIDSQRVEDF